MCLLSAGWCLETNCYSKTPNGQLSVASAHKKLCEGGNCKVLVRALKQCLLIPFPQHDQIKPVF